MIIKDQTEPITAIESEFKQRRKRIFISFFSLFGQIIFLVYAMLHLFVYRQSIIMTVSLFSCFIILLFNFFYIKRAVRLIFPSLIMVTVSYILVVLNIFYGANVQSRVFWILIMPLLIYYIFEKKPALILSFSGLILITAIFMINLSGYLKYPIDHLIMIDCIVLFVTISLVSYFFQDTNSKSDRLIFTQLYIDQITGLANRNALIKFLNGYHQHKLILIDVDNFKQINDLYGGHTGDMVLNQIGLRLRQFMNHQGVLKIYKLPADEFAIVIEKSLESPLLNSLAEDIVKSLSLTIQINSLDIIISVTIGISSTGEDILAQADMALKTAKDKRRNYAFFEQSMKIKENFENNLLWARNLRSAIEQNNLIPFYQPIINNLTEKVEKYESLVRMIHNSKVISPYYFLDISKKTKYYPEITKIMMEKTVRHFKDTRHEFSINICMDDILSKDSVQMIRKVIEENKIGSQIVFEITETEQMVNNHEVNDFFLMLKDMGCKIAIDDFGTGYSNFDYILKMPIDYIKLDGSLIKNIISDKNSQVIVQTIVDFTSKLKIKTIAEHVHNKEVYQYIKSLGINYSQGYYLGEPARE